jgi:hypothetical protein
MSERQDVVITRVREVRHRISEQCGHDPQRLIAYYLELQQQFTEQLLVDNHTHTSETKHSAVSAMSIANYLS